MTEQLAPPIAPSFELSSLEPIETFALQHGMPERVLELPQGFVATGEVVAEKGQHERSMLQLASIIERGEDGDTMAYILAADSIDDRGVPNRVVVLPYNADTETRGNRVRVSDVIRYNLAKGRSNTIKFGDEDDRIGQLSLQIDEGGPAKFIWKSLVAGKKPTVEIGIAAASEAVETNTNEVYLAESRRKRQTSRIRKLAAATALYATISSGGVVDNVMGHLHNPRETVMSDLKEASQLPESIDGTPFNALAPADQASYKHDVLLSQQATERVAQTMADLGHHNYGAIQDRAKAFIEAHADEIMPATQRDAFLKQLNEAPDKDASLKVLQEFMGYYGMTAGFNDEDSGKGEVGRYNHDATSNSDTQRAIRGVIEAFSYLPKSFITDGGFRTVLI